MQYANLGKSPLKVSRLCVGTMMFADQTPLDEARSILDHALDMGCNFLDTADVYSAWAPGHVGGESETIIGSWLKANGKRADVVIATKVAKLATRPGLSRANIITACDDSLKRLQTDYIDLYYAHEDDQTVPLEETLAAFTELRDAGKIRYAAASNYTGARLIEASQVSKANGLIEYVALQNEYNLLERDAYEADSIPALEQLGIPSVPYWALASGFLTGKYRAGVTVDSVRAGGMARYATDEGWALLAKLDSIAAAHSTTVSAIALAWLRQQPTVLSPIASARTVAQLHEIMPEVTLSADELKALG